MSRRSTLGLAALLAGLLAAVILPSLSAATPPGRNGEIAFARYRFVNSPLREEIWVVNPNGNGLRQVISAPANYLDSYPSWAPDGSKLLFTQCAPSKGEACAGRSTIWSVDADGSHLRMLSPNCRRKGTSPAAFARCPDEGQAAFSPHGALIAYTRFVGVPQIAIANSNLRQARVLHPFGSKPGLPDIDSVAWSPDGNRLAFIAHNDHGKRLKPVGGSAVYVIGTNGRGLRRVTPWGLHAGGVGELDWSPDGSRILFRSITSPSTDPGPAQGDIYTVRPDGTGLQRLTHFPAGTSVQLGSYSPDGTQIVFTTDHAATATSGSDWPDVFIMRADGTDVTPVTRTKNWEGAPQWGPAG
jgi:Tol biopolymer transport system component